MVAAMNAQNQHGDTLVIDQQTPVPLTKEYRFRHLEELSPPCLCISWWLCVHGLAGGQFVEEHHLVDLTLVRVATVNSTQQERDQHKKA